MFLLLMIHSTAGKEVNL